MYRKYTAFITYSLQTETLETIGALSWRDRGVEEVIVVAVFVSQWLL